ncbi:PD-(D/E)XK motif protein [Parafrigoribacterium soli]|uniref:PD-(D/E)XK motif protein n=1 Tax=Parafrigoribacterium soli TaxID=3144663 RepID=UPI0032ED2693
MFAIAEFASDAFEGLSRRITRGTGVMPAAWVPGRADALFALSEAGDYYLLISLDEPVHIAERRLNALRISSGGVFALSSDEPAENIEASFAAVVLERGHPELITAFGTLAGILLGSLSQSPSRQELTVFLDDFLDLFAVRRVVPRQKVVGLWGELWLMSQVSNPLRLAKAWHMDATARFDFSLENARIEVKTTERQTRTHRFSLAQLEVQPKPTWIASIVVVGDASGSSISDLLIALLNSLPPAEKAQVARKALEVVAGDLEATSDFRFAPSGAAPLALVEAQNIPRVAVPKNAAISDVVFSVDISRECAVADVSLGSLLA